MRFNLIKILAGVGHSKKIKKVFKIKNSLKINLIADYFKVFIHSQKPPQKISKSSLLRSIKHDINISSARSHFRFDYRFIVEAFFGQITAVYEKLKCEKLIEVKYCYLL